MAGSIDIMQRDIAAGIINPLHIGSPYVRIAYVDCTFCNTVLKHTDIQRFYFTE